MTCHRTHRTHASVLSWLLAAVALAFCSVAPASDSGAPARLKVIGYVMDGPQLPPISASKLDAINFAFALVDPQGRVYLQRDTAARSLAGLTALRRDNPQLQVLASVGGWGAGNFSEAALTAEARTRFADSIAALVLEHGLDGIDIDWEYPTLPGPGISHRPEDRDNFSLMLEAVRARLDALGREQGRHYLLTIAAADGEAARGLDLARITPLLDWINLMTYDFHGDGSTSHHTALDRSRLAPADARTTVQAVDEFLAAGVPPGKLNVGVAFYGREFDGVEPGNDGVHQRYARQLDSQPWSKLRDLDGHDGYVRHWDAAAQAPYLWNADARRFITYDDPQSLAAKAAFVRERGLGGMMYWEHRHDAGDELLDALRSGLDGVAAPAPEATP